MEKDHNVEIIERLVKIETLLEENYKNHEKRIASLESSQTWLTRTIVAIVISAILTVVLKGGF